MPPERKIRRKKKKRYYYKKKKVLELRKDVSKKEHNSRGLSSNCLVDTTVVIVEDALLAERLGTKMVCKVSRFEKTPCK
jgi:hypothetical protein